MQKKKKSHHCLVSQNLESPESVFPHPQDAVDRTHSFALMGETCVQPVFSLLNFPGFFLGFIRGFQLYWVEGLERRESSLVLLSAVLDEWPSLQGQTGSSRLLSHMKACSLLPGPSSLSPSLSALLAHPQSKQAEIRAGGVQVPSGLFWGSETVLLWFCSLGMWDWNCHAFGDQHLEFCFVEAEDVLKSED